ncbi:hypothetical protein B0T21DRAFT_357689 [Apiosordaria backusii]|uniref:2EXR domain-containing protein n=1 Tax=Apiosordaria backusii TaxID=314023 RepID=A0AA40K3A5_9PEZI|nr:hypothetical protein B0T21DRAFT_357689 [Apiosordaria backusii]
MAADFHFFPLLPWELREMIWKLAIRPALPGAHVFRVYNANDSEHNGPEHETSRDDYPWISKSRLAAPRCLPRGVDFDPAAQAAAPISWTLNNPSTYLIDSGLWAACKESLLVIENEFQNPARRQKVWSLSEVESFRKKRGRFTLPETATYTVSDNSRRRYLTVFPGQDLFILQPHDIAALNWDLIWDSFPSYRFLAGDWIRISWDECERHMALEYDPAWDKVAHNTRRGPAWDFIVDIVWNTALAGSFSLWFIDYRIKRSPRYQEPTKEQAKALGDKPPRAFYASDRRFVEVKEKQFGQWAGHDRMWDAGYEVPIEDLCFCCGAYEFVQRLRDELDNKWDYDENDWHGSFDFHWIEYGLLAYEYL